MLTDLQHFKPINNLKRKDELWLHWRPYIKAMKTWMKTSLNFSYHLVMIEI